MRCFTIATAAAAVLAGVATAATATATTTAKGVQQPSSRPVTMDPVVQGCWSSGDGLKMVNASVKFNSRSECGKTICQAAGYKVAATYQGSQCWCGDVYPPASKLVNDTECNVPCPGYDYDACGGPKAWTVYNTGLELYGVDNAPESSSSTSAPAATSAPSETVSDPAASQTASTSPSPSSDSSGGGNTAAIAAGVVVGLVALASIGGGIWFFLRRRRNREIEEEHRRNAAVNAFIHGNKPPGSSGGVSLTDSRMDPVMAQRRMSDGSIADNQDYSRRILRVTNA